VGTNYVLSLPRSTQVDDLIPDNHPGRLTRYHAAYSAGTNSSVCHSKQVPSAMSVMMAV